VQNEENFVNWDKPKQKYLPFQNQTITWRNFEIPAVRFPEIQPIFRCD
jgi:hypothetical protein